MPRFAHYVITWGEEAGRVPPAEGVGELASSAAANSGELLAVGPVHDVSERQARPVPEWLAVAGFRDPAGARAWVAGAQERLGTTTFAAPALTEPVWWPEEMTGQRVDWSRKPEPPLSRLGLFVVIWFELTDPVQFLDYSAHYKWTVEHAGGACLVGSPGAELLHGDTVPEALAVMAWPDDGARQACYDGDEYRPYKQQRHRASRSTNISVLAREMGRPRRHIQ